MQFFDSVFIPIIAILLGFTVAVLLLTLPMYRYKGKVSESSIILKIVLLILLALGIGTILFVYSIVPSYILFAVYCIAIPATVCYLFAHVCKKEVEKW